MTEFNNPILAGDVLVRQAMESENFVSGSAGWRIARDGTVEFQEGTFRGNINADKLIVGAEGMAQVIISDDDPPWSDDLSIIQMPVGDNLAEHGMSTGQGQPAHINNGIEGSGDDARIHLSLDSGSTFDEDGFGAKRQSSLIQLFNGSTNETQNARIILGGTNPFQEDSDVIVLGTSTLRYGRHGSLSDTLIITRSGIQESNMRPQHDSSTATEDLDGGGFTPDFGEVTSLGIVFTAPPSGVATVTWYDLLELNLSGSASGIRVMDAHPYVRTGGTLGSGSDVATPQSQLAQLRSQGHSNRITDNVSNVLLLSGLTAGNEYNVRMAYRLNDNADTSSARSYSRTVLVRPEM